tara:strand:+ start:409 stop:618 length:210 start_codon:yes stop_codon:yes gene_type:complete
MLRTHAENNHFMTRQHHEAGLLCVAQLRRSGNYNAARNVLAIVTRSRLAFGHLWLPLASAQVDFRGGSV